MRASMQQHSRETDVFVIEVGVQVNVYGQRLDLIAATSPTTQPKHQATTTTTSPTTQQRPNQSYQSKDPTESQLLAFVSAEASNVASGPSTSKQPSEAFSSSAAEGLALEAQWRVRTLAQKETPTEKKQQSTKAESTPTLRMVEIAQTAAIELTSSKSSDNSNADLSLLSTNQLQTKCELLGLSQQGLKSTLIRRLQQHAAPAKPAPDEHVEGGDVAIDLLDRLPVSQVRENYY